VFYAGGTFCLSDASLPYIVCTRENKGTGIDVGEMRHRVNNEGDHLQLGSPRKGVVGGGRMVNGPIPWAIWTR